MPAPDPAADEPDDDAQGVAVAAAPPEAAPGDTGGEPASLPPEEIEALLAAAAEGSVELPPEEEDDGENAGPASSTATSNAAGFDSHPSPAAVPVGGQVDRLLEEVEAGLRDGRTGVIAAGDRPPADLGTPSPLELEQFAGDRPADGGSSAGLGALDDVELDLRIELGRTEMRLEDVVNLRDGSVVTLDKLAGDPVDVLVNGRLVARGEVLVLNDNFCVRIAEILAPDR